MPGDRYPVGKTLLENFISRTNDTKKYDKKGAPRSQARLALEQQRARREKQASFKEVVKEVTSGKQSENKDVVELRRGIGLCSACFFLSIALLVLGLLALYAKDYKKDDVLEIIERWSRQPVETEPVLPTRSPKVEPDLEHTEVDEEQQKLEHKEKHKHDAVASVIDVEQPIPGVLEYLSPPPPGGDNSTSGEIPDAVGPESSEVARSDAPAPGQAPSEASGSSEATTTNATGSSLQFSEDPVSSIPRLFGDHRHVSLVAPPECVLRSRTSDKPLVGLPLPRSSLDAELVRLILPTDPVSEGDIYCQFLTRQCLELAECEAYIEQQELQVQLLADKAQGVDAEVATEAHARQFKQVLKQYHVGWLPSERAHLPVVRAFELQMEASERMGGAQPHRAVTDADKELLASWGQIKGMEVPIDDPSLPAVVAQNALKIYMADPFERVRDLKRKLKLMSFPFGMATMARKAAIELDQTMLEGELLRKIERLAAAVSLMEQALSAARQSARFAQVRLVQQGAVGKEVVQAEEEEEDKWPHPITREDALEAGVKDVDWFPPRPPPSTLVDGVDASNLPLSTDAGDVKKREEAESARQRIYQRARLSKVYRELNKTDQLVHAPGMGKGFMGRCAYVADMRDEGLGRCVGSFARRPIHRTANLDHQRQRRHRSGG